MTQSYLPLVSVIIPTYNGGHYINDCLQSIINCTYPHLEVIIIDDHSSDNSYEILNQYVSQYPHIIDVYHNPKVGAPAARNYGFQKSNGEYIQFLDVDDILSKKKIERQINALSQHRDSVSNCGWIHFTKVPDEQMYSPQMIDKDYEEPIDWLIDSWTGHGMGQTGCWLIPRELCEKVGGWDEGLIKNQDGNFFSRILMVSSRICFVEDSYVYYRKPTKNNISSNQSIEAASSILQSYKSYESVLKFVDTSRVRAALCNNYNSFVYQFYNKYPDLANVAIKYIEQLGNRVNVKFSNRMLNLFNRIWGLKRTMFIRKLVKGY